MVIAKPFIGAFLGLKSRSSPTLGLLVGGKFYLININTKMIQLLWPGLRNSSPVDTPMKLNVKYSKDDGDLHYDPTSYRQFVGNLICLTITRPDIAYAVNLMSQII